MLEFDKLTDKNRMQKNVWWFDWYKPKKNDNKKTVCVSCFDCGLTIPLKGKTISFDGVVSGTVRCLMTKCNFYTDNLALNGWEGKLA